MRSIIGIGEMKNKNLGKILGIGLLSGLAGFVNGCKSPEQIGYENTRIRLAHDFSPGRYSDNIEFVVNYPRGIDKIEIYGDEDELLFSEDISEQLGELKPGYHL